MTQDSGELSIEEKFTDLESKYSFQENMLAELNDALVSQQQQLDSLKHELVTVKQHLTQMTESPSKSEHYSSLEVDDKPPHY